MSRCQLCDAVIDWKTTVSGLRLPVDITPSDSGALRILKSGHVQIIPMEDRPETPPPRYTSHWTTCPAAAAAKQGPRHEDQG